MSEISFATLSQKLENKTFEQMYKSIKEGELTGLLMTSHE